MPRFWGRLRSSPACEPSSASAGRMRRLFQLTYSRRPMASGSFQHERSMRVGDRIFHRPAGGTAGLVDLRRRFPSGSGEGAAHPRRFHRAGSDRAANPAPVACRCTVFTKSDMIHLQNKGELLCQHHCRAPLRECRQLPEHHRRQPGARRRRSSSSAGWPPIVCRSRPFSTTIPKLEVPPLPHFPGCFGCGPAGAETG